MIKLSIWLEKIPDKGEDASPVTECFEDGSGLVAVFDGLGGSGSTQYPLDDQSFTGAWLASRISRSLFLSFFRKAQALGMDEPGQMAEAYAEVLKELLAVCLEKLDTRPSRIRSSMIRPLPTTLSALYFRPTGENAFQTWCMNAGDSRSYILDPEKGLQQVSHDDIVTPADALGTLYASTRISNCISADGKFKLRVDTFSCSGPVIFLSASDGCFDYVPFPAHFEHILMDNLMLSRNAEEWEVRLMGIFRSIAGDDVSLGAIATGWKRFGDMKDAFSERAWLVKQQYADPVEEMENRFRAVDPPSPEMENERVEFRKQLWESYRIGYMQQLNP